MTGTISRPLADRLVTAPRVCDRSAVDRGMNDLRAAIGIEPSLGTLAGLLQRPEVRALIDGILSASPYLTGVILRQPAWLLHALQSDPGSRLSDLALRLSDDVRASRNIGEAMTALRTYKAEAALVVALADIGGALPIMATASAITEIADTALRTAVEFLLRRSEGTDATTVASSSMHSAASGYIVLGMGKYGAGELNYSSDIDLIVLFDRDRFARKSEQEPQALAVRLTRDLVRMMQERTAAGYVFRTDLRLRPDPGATQIALSTSAAMQYYESFGQNWERAALIKARAVAGDIEAGETFLSEISPFVWRRYLDYAAIADIHAMKRQIHAFKGFGAIGVAGHNIKLGRGGIREIEFFAQTQQLIAGGRQRDLRSPRTLETLATLVARNWITAEAATELDQAYKFLRTVEHRLQMIDDEQTQTLPDDEEKLERFAAFLGFDSARSFGAELTRQLTLVQGHYGALFEDTPELTSEAGGNLVFTGDSDDPATVETLARMGYGDPAAVIAIVKGWHFGRYPAMRSARARERLTEFQPVLLDALAKTDEPNAALGAFDRFLAELPAGVQLFSLLRSNPNLLRLIADIMGMAPRLARILGRRSRLLDAVLDPGFFGAEPSPEAIATRAHEVTGQAIDYQECLDRARIFGNEQAFLIGVRLLSGTTSAERAGQSYACLAESLIRELLAAVERGMADAFGMVEGGEAVVLAMGKLGGREMAANSDLDLIVIYDCPDDIRQSNGRRPLAVSQYYARLTQRLVSALTSPTAEGHLYEVDMRLRPSGHSGPVATHLTSFEEYQRGAAWTWEHMALTRARVIAGSPSLKSRVEKAITDTLCLERQPATLANDVRDMRSRIAAEKGTDAVWDLKQVRGGIVDLEFIAQYLQLLHAHAHPQVLDQSTLGALTKLRDAGLIQPADAETLISAGRLYQSLQQVHRLCLEGQLVPEKAPRGLRQLLARAAGMPDFERLEDQLRSMQHEAHALFERIIG
ncbi:MAG: bifunctional [glutamine synthetase] adenylyltransferase/[glutamine synthetase]-adenylyl-L-tyrosine phosphorylase [Hyphomicrobiaceae bacterium]